MRNFYKSKGFTIIELLLSVTLLSIITGMSVPFFLHMQRSNDLSNTLYTYVNVSRRAKNLAQSQYLDSEWGVSVQPNEIILYKGQDFDSREIAYDESYFFSNSIDVTGVSDVSYSKLYGIPSTEGTVLISSDDNVLSVYINSKGFLEY